MDIPEGEIPVKVKRRLELFGLFYPMDRKEERQWGKLFEGNFSHLVVHLEKLSAKKEYNQEIIEDQFQSRVPLLHG